MSTITVQTGEIDTYQGDETAPLLRIFVSKNFVASDGDTILRSTPESGDFYKEIACVAAANIVTYPQFEIDSTTDAASNPSNARYRFDLFTAQGVYIQNVFKNWVIGTTTPTTLGALAVTNEDAVPAAEAEAYTQAQTDALLDAKITGNNIDKISVDTLTPTSPTVGDFWLDTN